MQIKLSSPSPTARRYNLGHFACIIDQFDYDGSETYASDEGYVEINDRPGFRMQRGDRFELQVISYQFFARNYVKEAKEVRGNIVQMARFYWDNDRDKPAEWVWAVRSSDGNINESEAERFGR